MGRAAIQNSQMHVGARRLRETLKKILHKFRLKIADALRRKSSRSPRNTAARQDRLPRRPAFRPWASENIRRAECRVFPKRLHDRFAQRDAHVFHRVVLIHFQVAFAPQFARSNAPCRATQIQHVIEKANARGDSRLAAAVQIQLQPNLASLWCCDEWSAMRAMNVFLVRLDEIAASSSISFLSRADRNPHESRANISARSRTKIPSLRSFLRKSPGRSAEIRQEKISSAGKVFTPSFCSPCSNHSRDPRCISLNIIAIAVPSSTAASAAASAADFTGKGGIARRTSASDSRAAITAPRRKPASPAAFENVRATNSCGYSRIHGTTVSPEKSAYASSTPPPCARPLSKSFRNSLFWHKRPRRIVGIREKKDTRASCCNASNNLFQREIPSAGP